MLSFSIIMCKMKRSRLSHILLNKFFSQKIIFVAWRCMKWSLRPPSLAKSQKIWKTCLRQKSLLWSISCFRISMTKWLKSHFDKQLVLDRPMKFFELKSLTNGVRRNSLILSCNLSAKDGFPVSIATKTEA